MFFFKGRAVSVDLSKYFDTLNHELLMNLLHRQIQDLEAVEEAQNEGGQFEKAGHPG